MTVRVGRLNGQNLNYLDYDVSTIDTALVNPGIISGMKVVAGKVQVGRALMQVTRTSVSPNQTFLVHVEVSEEENIDTTGTKKVWIEVNQLNINNGTLATDPTGAGIAKIMTGASYPTSNFLPLASITGGVITDERIFIKGKNVMRTGGTPGLLQFDASGDEVSNSTLPSSVIDFIAQHSTISNTITEKSGYTITGTLGENITGIVPVSIIRSRNNANFVPQLTSNTSNSNFTVSTSKSYSSSHEGYNAFNDTNNVWYMYTSPAGQWIKMQFSSVRCITSLYARSKDANFSVGWKFQASNNNSSWVDLYTSTNQITTGGGTFSFTNTNFYKYYRIYFPYSIPNNVSMHRINFTESFSPSGTILYRSMNDTGDFGVVTGFLKGPKIQGDTVDVPVSEFAPIKGMSGLTANTIYYLGNTPGTLSTSPGSHKRIVGYTLDDPTVLITYNGKYLPGSNLAKDIT